VDADSAMRLKLVELRNELAKRNLPTTGLKADLRTRLIGSLDSAMPVMLQSTQPASFKPLQASWQLPTKSNNFPDERYRKNRLLYTQLKLDEVTLEGERMREKPKILAPAGGWPQVHAAVAAGADAIYFGCSAGLNARARASNFEVAELAPLMAHLHERGLEGYMCMNVLVFDAELELAEDLVRTAVAAGVDALIVQVQIYLRSRNGFIFSISFAHKAIYALLVIFLQDIASLNLSVQNSHRFPRVFCSRFRCVSCSRSLPPRLCRMSGSLN
jgi:hypothetical protein